MHLCSQRRPTPLTRREMLRQSSMGFGGLALAGLVAGESKASPVLPQPHFTPRAKNIIFLFMEGGISQVDAFDYKPKLKEYAGQPFPTSIEPTQFNQIGNTLPNLWDFKPYGESGILLSDMFPRIGGVIDEFAMIRSMVSDFPEHTNANYHMHTCSGRQGFPSAGAWISYGLGSENENLPAYIVLESNSFLPPGGPDNFGAGFLPASYQGSMFRASQQAVANIDPAEADPVLQSHKLDLVHDLDVAATAQQGSTDAVEAAIANFELAARMQTAVPELMDLSGESEGIRRMYGLDSQSTRKQQFARECLLARRMVEQGVRFVEVLMPDEARWDQHDRLREDHFDNAMTVDQPIAALITDLKQRGLLEETLVVWTGEFGRTPFAQGPNGRDHNQYGFSLLMAGGGIRGGTVYGATDEFGYKVIENKVTVYDLYATVMHLLGIDHERLTYRYSGRDMRLTDVHGEVVSGVLS